MRETGRGPLLAACINPGRVQLGCWLAIATAQLNPFFCAFLSNVFISDSTPGAR